MVELRSCNCFFDVCSISLYKKETYGQLVERIYKLLEFRYDEEVKNHLCSDTAKPPRFCISCSWVLRTREFVGFSFTEIILKGLLTIRL